MSEQHVEPMTAMEKIEWMLDTHGWAVEPVAPVDDPAAPEPGYTYTIGLESMLGHPEVVVFGLAPAAARGLLDLAVQQIRDGVTLPVSQPFVGLLDGDLRAMLVPVDTAEHGHRFPTLGQVHGDQPWRIVQFVWPARNGAFPWEDGWPHELRLAQPVIGT